MRKANNLKKPGAAKAGEAPGESDGELKKHQPKPKPPKKVWDPMNRKVHEDPPRAVMSTCLRRTSTAAQTRTARRA